jgi:hypothetical protein
MSPSDKAIKSSGEGVAEKKRRNQACLVCFFEARGRLSPQNPFKNLQYEPLHNYLYQKNFGLGKNFPNTNLILHLQNYSICKPTISKKIRPESKMSYA